MSSVAKTRCFTCECALALLFLPALAGAVELRPSLGLGGGYLNNPFFDDDTLRAQSPIAGPVGFVAPAFFATFLSGQNLEVGIASRFTRYGGEANALARHLRFEGTWQARSGGRLSPDLALSGRHDGIDRFADDTRNGGRLEAGLSWRPTPRLRLRPNLNIGGRDFPERTLPEGGNQRDFLLEGGIELSGGPFLVGGLLSSFALSFARAQLDTNADGLDRQSHQAGLGWIGHRGKWQAETSLAGWLEEFPAVDRQDRGLQVTAGLSHTLWPGVALGVEAHGLLAGSDLPEGRYRQWGGLLVVELAPHFSPPLDAAEDEPGVQRLEDGRWRFVIAAPEARRVDLVGDFNHWQLGRHPMERMPGRPLWTLTVRLPPGQQTWMWVIDATRFVTPGFGPTRDDGFGRQVGVIRVSGSAQP